MSLCGRVNVGLPKLEERMYLRGAMAHSEAKDIQTNWPRLVQSQGLGLQEKRKVDTSARIPRGDEVDFDKHQASKRVFF